MDTDGTTQQKDAVEPEVVYGYLAGTTAWPEWLLEVAEKNCKTIQQLRERRAKGQPKTISLTD